MAAREVLTVRAELEDDLSRPLDKVRRKVDDLGDEVASTARQSGRLNAKMGELSAVSGRATRGLGRMASTLGRSLASAARVGAAAIAGATVAVGAAGFQMMKLASNAEETLSKFNAVFGESAAAMNSWVAELHAASGIATQELQDSAAIFGVLGKQAGATGPDLEQFSQQLVQAGLDLGSFHNANPEEVFNALRSGLTGEAEPLKRFNIFMNEASLNAFALEKGLGKTTQQMTEQEKVALRQQFIMANLGDAEGDLARTQGSLANTTKSLRGRIKEAATVIGTAFLPYVTSAADKLDDLAANVMPRLQDKLDSTVRTIEYWGPAIQERAGLAWSALREGEGVGEAVNQALGPGLEPIVPVIENVMGVLRDIGTVFTDLLIPSVQEASAVLPDFLQPTEVLRDVLGFVAQNANTLVPIVSALIVGYTAWKAATIALNIVTAASNALQFLRIASTSGLAAAQLAATGSTGALAAGTATLNAIMALNPVVLVVAALAALAVGLIVAYKRSEKFRAVVQAMWTWVKKAASAIRSALGGAIDWVAGKFRALNDRIAGFKARLADIPGVGRLFGGDTATPRAGSGALGHTLAAHAQVEGAASGRRSISNALYSANGVSDHTRGRALDLVGSGLGAYRRTARALGHYAEFHGDGGNRHLHVAYGDTATPRARVAADVPGGGGGAGVVVTGPLVGTVYATADVDVEAAVERAYRRLQRDRTERS